LPDKISIVKIEGLKEIAEVTGPTVEEIEKLKR